MQKPNNGGRPFPGYCWNTAGHRISDEQVKEWLLEAIADEEESYGYRKLTKYLQRHHKLKINKKRVYRLCAELDLLQPRKPKSSKYPRRIVRNHKITASNQLWEVDIKYVYIIGEDRFCFLMSMIDVFDREIIDYHLGLSCTGEDAKQLLQRCLWRCRLIAAKDKLIVRTDNGPQFICQVFEETCLEYNVEHERIPPKTPNMNAHIESFHAQIERDRLSRYDLGSYQEAYEVVSNYIDFYNHRRIHRSLFDMPPVEYRKANAEGIIVGKVVEL